MANSIIGTHGSMGAGLTCSTPPSQPHWKMATMIP